MGEEELTLEEWEYLQWLKEWIKDNTN